METSLAGAVLSVFRYSVVLAPLSIIAARKHRPHVLLLLYYAILAYVGCLGDGIIGHACAGVPPCPQQSVRDGVLDCFGFSAIFALLNLAPSGIIWGVARWFVLRGQRSLS